MKHESAVTAVSVSDDALRLLVGTESRTMGVLDVCTHSYTTTMRSHFGSVTAIARDVSGTRDEFATVSDDGTVRVWMPSTATALGTLGEVLCVSSALIFRTRGGTGGVGGKKSE